MQTNFSLAQLADPTTAEANDILRKCVHCGFCTATCPTFVLLGDELDSPRGRIYLMKEMLEQDRPATREDALHIDRCLSCLSCTTTCPSGVDYKHLIDIGRQHVEKTWRRPLADRLMRALIANVLPNRERFRAALAMRALAAPFRGLIARAAAGAPALRPVAAMLKLGPATLPTPAPRPRGRSRVAPANGPRRGRVAILQGCAQAVLAPGINAAAARLLTRAGYDVVEVAGEECCGSLTLHMGRDAAARETARQTIDAWMREIDGDGLDFIVVTASGCGTTIKDYGHLFAQDPAYAEKASRVAALARDVTEILDSADLGAPERGHGRVVAYHSACSMQHGQKIGREPKALLTKAGFVVKDVPEGHLCCGSAGTYNILQPAIAERLRDRKLANIAKVTPDVIATGNIGCMTQLAAGPTPIVHTVELLDWAYGGAAPAGMA
ncbi:heterodisulfide reductase-related iron-sulfur binding cluster [Segnochrobactrum spirostomi]|uniref:Glycolate oxidase iron-sulfur subunit n=1 Tax=Segnochrobactrum spirostomi TaxID=2608987 RepID=A0A6A7Y5I5_9HYPH|nr:heterodisulfide reductase-related iron-sulfur binding cluster [Segnochrobactrum spirostomi]MQT14026.1 4Fe-4S dicluster domain-containing protein [Segnochrobactrum spirostomi]